MLILVYLFIGILLILHHFTEPVDVRTKESFTRQENYMECLWFGSIWNVKYKHIHFFLKLTKPYKFNIIKCNWFTLMQNFSVFKQSYTSWPKKYIYIYKLTHDHVWPHVKDIPRGRQLGGNGKTYSRGEMAIPNWIREYIYICVASRNTKNK